MQIRETEFFCRQGNLSLKSCLELDLTLLPAGSLLNTSECVAPVKRQSSTESLLILMKNDNTRAKTPTLAVENKREWDETNIMYSIMKRVKDKKLENGHTMLIFFGM